MNKKTLLLGYFHNLWCSPTILRAIEWQFDTTHIHSDISDFLVSKSIPTERIEKILVTKKKYSYNHFRDDIGSNNIQIYTKRDLKYPKNLRNASTSPEIIYIQWSLGEIDRSISIVWSRQYQQYSIDSLKKIIPSLVSSGYNTVSGGAIGLDSIAHKLTIQHNWCTHAILGSGILKQYPKSNTSLFKEIVHRWGSIISQFPLHQEAQPYHFPIRNQTVATLSRATLIAQAGKKSGTCITARLALEENREVFIVPANLGNVWFEWSLKLIRDGLWKLITSVDDILIELDGNTPHQTILFPEFRNPLQEKLFNSISKNEFDIQKIPGELWVNADKLIIELSQMEINGYIEKTNAGYSIGKPYI